MHLQQMLEDGADMIDIGAESTRPSATPITSEEEWQRLEKILPEIVNHIKKFNQANNKNIQSSIDSYHYETLAKAYNLGVDVINDVKGLSDERIVDFIAKTKATTILMHNVAIPTNPDLIINKNLNVAAEILNWAKNKIAYLEEKGVEKSQLIFDLGIGFGKDATQSIRILKYIEDYQVLGLSIYIGHSKKSFLEKINCHGDRAQKTLIISEYLIKKRVDYLRIHDVKSHVNLKNTKSTL